MFFRVFVNLFLGLLFIVSSGLIYANTSDSTTISISIVVPERAEDKKCTIGFENSHNNQVIPLQHSGCSYQSNMLLHNAYQQASKQNIVNSQGFITVVVTAP